MRTEAVKIKNDKKGSIKLIVNYIPNLVVLFGNRTKFVFYVLKISIVALKFNLHLCRVTKRPLFHVHVLPRVSKLPKMSKIALV